jgi:GT2 family glycosyltransferase
MKLTKTSPNPTLTQSHLIFGQLENINGGIQGWAIDRLDPQTPLQLRLTIDGRPEAVLNCNIQRPDLAHLHLPAQAIGFAFKIPPRFHDGTRHVLALATLQGAPLALPNAANRFLSEIHFTIDSGPAIDGVLDGLIDGMIQGWALKTDAAGRKTGGLRLLISADGQPIAELTADQFRADVRQAGAADPSCGFAYALPPELRNRSRIRLEVHAMPGRLPLRHSPMELILPTLPERANILALIDRADDLFRFAHQLQKDLRAALPAERYSLANYEAWALQNQAKLAARAAARYGEIAGRPSVSILCPVFRPNLPDFLAAIDSVRAQSYENWELILVDDASRDAALRQAIATLARDEPRIRAFANPQNTGISAATNRALAEARGELTVLFDHDDVLDPHALEVMLRARTATGARLLYSDEDKINHAGRFAEPNLKPDFNYRFLLELNYICHLVMVETSLARAAGGLNPRFDGAQDHDFLLRLTELLPAEAIHHVPEILYHWRISPSSTAGQARAKPRAAAAGVQAISEHLERRNIGAEISQRGDLTCYRVTFTNTENPGISILIPFRDRIAMTQDCVEAIRELTRDVDYEIILLDNWSTSPQAEAFCAAQANLPDTRVIRIAEPFNFSRINNIGAAAAKHPFLLFMNNDVRVSSENWLRILLNEALADPKTAAVGAKLLYPGGNIQHAGVVLGIGGVADHAFRGLPSAAPGYLAYAIAAREVAAVTAACMLVRADAFNQAGGFDETELGIAFNDIDLCIKLRQAGHRILCTPECTAEHQESASRGDDFAEQKLARFMRENQVMLQRWQHLLPHDPFYNPHFARDGGIYRDLRVLEPQQEASSCFSEKVSLPGYPPEEPKRLLESGSLAPSNPVIARTIGVHELPTANTRRRGR